MVTILPLDVDEEMVREGLAFAVGDRLKTALRNLSDLSANLVAGGLIGREEWARAFSAIDELRATAEPILEYAHAFEDQWDTGEDPEGDGETESVT